MTVEELADALRLSLPSRDGNVRMECVNVRRDPGTGFVATLRLSTHDAHGVRDIKEQDVVLVRRDQCDDLRLATYIDAWCASLARMFAREGIARFDTLLPHDLVFPRVLELRRASTQADFEKAFDAKSRLG